MTDCKEKLENYVWRNNYMFIALQSILLIVGIILVILGVKEKENRKISRVLKVFGIVMALAGVFEIIALLTGSISIPFIKGE